MRTTWPKTDGIVVRGRRFLQSELVLIRKLIRDHPAWRRTKLSEGVCWTLNWRQKNGRLKDRGCRVALLKLEALGFLQLPPRKIDRGGRPPRQHLDRNFRQLKVSEMPTSLELDLVKSREQSRIWNSLIAQHHYLGLATPVGRLLRYLISGDGQILGAISFSEAAWSIVGRDKILGEFGISHGEIKSAVISNNRFLILPQVQVRNLASRVLAVATKQVILDWMVRFGPRPLFIETFVDPSRFEGVCYRAANWTLVGTTKGFAKRGAHHVRRKRPKLLFLYGTTSASQQFLVNRHAAAERRAA